MSSQTRHKIIPRIFGGLGNQLFCYAAARRLAHVLNAELVIDDFSGFAYDADFQRCYQLDHFSIPCRKATAAERLEPFGRVRRMLKRTLNRRRSFVNRHYIQQEGIDFDPRLLQVKIHGTVYLEGYWQSEGYFIDVEPLIREDLRIKPPADAYNQRTAERMAKSLAVAVHVRFFDDPVDGNATDTFSNNAPGSYYTRAIRGIEHRMEGAHYFVFSDHPQAARACIPLPDERVTLVSHNHGDDMAYADLWLMTHCQHFIIANSTFSWWGAWLAKSPDKVIIAPGYEKRDGKMSWGFLGLLPNEWIKL